MGPPWTMNRVPPNKWAPLVKRPLGEGVQPFGELRRAVPRASPKERTRGLRSLDRDVFLAVLLDVYDGTAEHWDGLVDARERADRPEAGSPVDNVLTRNSQVRSGRSAGFPPSWLRRSRRSA
ncbi:hypothetical protein SAMN05216533_0281 [Streptomyces sp. Ag109_O5-10]|nr:hypothetical protein SAMN05216533_0281 [Streptomyces sp. Ag109_O5-10]